MEPDKEQTNQPEEEKNLSENPDQKAPPNGDEPATPDPEKTPVPGVDLSAEIAGALSEGKPEKQPHFTEKVQQQRALKNAQAEVDEIGGDWRYLKDKSGRYWSPDVCVAAIDPKTGQPKQSARGLWVLQRGKTAADRKKLPKRPPNNEAQAEKATAEAQAQVDAETQAQEIQAKAAVNAGALLAGYIEVSKMMNGPETVKTVMEKSLGTDQHKVSVYQLHEFSLQRYLIEKNGGPSLSPGIQLLLCFGLSSAAMFFSQEKRRATVKERAGLWFHRFRQKRNGDQGEPEQKTEGAES